MSAAIRTVTHTASGASIRIHPYGATVLSYCRNGSPATRKGGDGQSSSSEHPLLFVSQLAALDGSRPIRGGIPVVFPIFGPPPSDDLTGSSSNSNTMPQHGFARCNIWTFVADYDKTEFAGISFQLELKDVTVGRGTGNPWEQKLSGECPYDCRLLLSVTFNASRLVTKLTVHNTGRQAFPFQALLHTYYRIEDRSALQADQCFVRGLQGYTCTDKVGATTSLAPVDPTNDETVTVTGEVDRVYTPPPPRSTAPTSCEDGVNVTIGVGKDRTVHTNATAAVNHASVPVSCVVWNPFAEKAAAMTDFQDDEYRDMLCVEPGILGHDVVLQPGHEAWLQQVVNL